MSNPALKTGGTDVANVEPVKARIPYHPRIHELFEIDDTQWKALVESVFPTATSADSVALALSYCKARRLDPMKKPVHIVPIWDNQQRKMVDTVWPSLNLYRTEAARTGHYAGIDPAEFGPSITQTLSGKKNHKDDQPVDMEVTYPEWCRVTVYRMVHGERVAFQSPTVRWKEYYAAATRGSAIPNEQWARRPFYMIEKVAESQALRRAFPEECSEPTAEEMEAHAVSPLRDVTPRQTGFERRALEAKRKAEEQAKSEQEEAETNEDPQAEERSSEEDTGVDPGETTKKTHGAEEATQIDPDSNAYQMGVDAATEGFPGRDASPLKHMPEDHANWLAGFDSVEASGD